jgi:RHS repeat-associated protein
MSNHREAIMSSIRRGIAAALVSVQIAAGVPQVVTAAHAPQSPRAGAQRVPPAVHVNRTVPRVTAPPSRPVFSMVPTDAEILASRVLPEPLVPIGESTPDENVALASALRTFAAAREPDTMGAIGRFMETHPTSVWQPSLLLNAGLVWLRQGFFTRAAQDFRTAWTLAKDLPSLPAHRVADQAVGELIRLESRLGHADILEALIAEVGDRPLLGAASEMLSNGKGALWVMRKAPEEAFRCGPYALAQMISAIRSTDVDAKLLMTRTGPNGISLARLSELAALSGVPTVPIVRESGQGFGVPGVVHLKTGHFAAIVQHEGDRYLLRDATVDGDLWVTAAALNEEASGAMLVPSGRMPSGWRVMPTADAGRVWGRGNAPNPDPNGPDPDDPTSPPPPQSPCGCATYRAHLLQASLNVLDTPLFYTPAIGPAVQFGLVYNQRESHQPQTFTYSNLGAKWTTDWLSYVKDDPTNPSAAVAVFRRGGGEEPYSGYDSGTGRFAMNVRAHVVLARTSTSPVRYERQLPDGSKEVFAQADGAASYPRRVFMTQSIDPQGNALTFTYDAQLRLVAVSDALGQVTTLSYELPQDTWKITKVTDPFGRFITLAYDDAGRLQRITDVIQISSLFTYAADGFLTSLTTPYGTSRFTVADSGSNRTLEMTDATGGKERVEFRVEDTSMAASESPSTVPTISGVTFNNAYLQYRNTLYWDRKAMAIGAGDRTKAHLYHWVHLKGDATRMAPILESEKAALENRVWYLYPNQAGAGWEGDGRSPTAIARVLDDGTTLVTKAEYNSLGQVTRRTDPLGRETVFEYDANAIDLLRIKQKSGAGYDVLQTRTYNSQHQPLTVTDAAGQVTTLAYTGSGQIAAATNPRNDTTTFGYNVSNQLTSVTGPVSGATVSFTYDGYGRIRTSTDPDGYTVTTDYDAFDRPIQVTYPDGTTEQLQYRFLELVRRKDRLGRWTSFTYDAARRQTSVRDPLGRVVQQEWCSCGTLNAVIDPNGNRTSWDTDVQGRVTKETRANGSFTTYAYETTTSRLKSVTDPKLQVTTYSYAKDDALTGVVYTNATTATPTVSFTYDTVYPRMVTMTDGIGTSAYSYIAVGTLGAGQRATVDGPLANDTISYTYDELGRVQTRTLSGVTDTWNYDALGRLQTEVDPIGTFTFGYDGATARLQQLAYPNGQTSTYSYFGNTGDRRLQDIHHQTGSGGTLSRFTYAYDGVGNITTWTQQYGTDIKAYDLTYDAADQLTGAAYRTTDATPTIVKRYGYTYDPTGNRTTARTDDTPILYGYNNLNQLTSQAGGGVVEFAGTTSEPATVTVNGTLARGAGGSVFSGSAVLASGTSTVAIAATDASGNTATASYDVDVAASSGAFTYDANGDLTAQGTTTYEWDAANRLVRVADGATELARFAYDGYGRRAQKISGGTTRSFVYDGIDIVEERVATSTTRTVHGPGIDQPLASVDGTGAVSYYLADHLGSIVQQTDASAAVTLTRRYDPFGVPLQGTNTSGYAFTGREWDAETFLYSYRSRSYDPLTARFISEDTVGMAGGINLFAYVQGNPVRFIDPLGRALTTVDAAMQQAIMKGDVAEVKALLEVTNDALSSGMRRAASVAIENGSTTEGGAKSAAELAKHLGKVADAEDALAGLKNSLEDAATKARKGILDAIDDAVRDIKGHLKEIRQKWGNLAIVPPTRPPAGGKSEGGTCAKD